MDVLAILCAKKKNHKIWPLMDYSNLKSPLMKTLDRNVETLGLES